MKIRRTALGLAIAGLVGTSASQAVDLSQISINGFGSVVGGINLADKQPDVNESYFGNDENWSFQPESRFALQVSAPIGEKWSATAQILARGENNFDPRFEWAYVGYKVNDDLKILMGRQRFKLYKYSDYLDVGYAYPWIRPPQGTYALPFSSGDGVSAVYTTYSGDLEMTFIASSLGINIPDYVPTGDVTSDPAELNIEQTGIFSADFVLNDFNFGFNVAYVPDFSYNIEGVNAALAPLDALAQSVTGESLPQSIRDDILVETDKALTYGIYFGYDPGPFFILAEFSEFDYDPSILADTQSMYVTAGIRQGLWTFHATYGIDDNEASSNADAAVTSLLGAGAGAAVKDSLSLQVEDSTTTSLGVRYDIDTGIALKGDFTLYQNTQGSAEDAKVLAVGVDFVF